MQYLSQKQACVKKFRCLSGEQMGNTNVLCSTGGRAGSFAGEDKFISIPIVENGGSSPIFALRFLLEHDAV
jgi:hypothetical protein